MKEIWKDIENYEGKYQVSNFGKVKSLNYRRMGVAGLLKPENNGKDYLAVNLCKDGKYKHFYVHRLVGIAFIDNPNNLPQINHIKEFEKDNNCVDNLEWCNAEYNVNYGTRTQRQMDTQNGVGEIRPKTLVDVPLDYLLNPSLHEKDDYMNPFWFKSKEIVRLKDCFL